MGSSSDYFKEGAGDMKSHHGNISLGTMVWREVLGLLCAPFSAAVPIQVQLPTPGREIPGDQRVETGKGMVWGGISVGYDGIQSKPPPHSHFLQGAVPCRLLISCNSGRAPGPHLEVDNPKSKSVLHASYGRGEALGISVQVRCCPRARMHKKLFCLPSITCKSGH